MNENSSPLALSFTICDLPYEDSRGEALREAMGKEMGERYSGAFAGLTSEELARADASMVIHPDDVRAVLVAFAPDGTPAAHSMLREHQGEWELKRMYTAPEFRGTGIGSRLLRETHEVARAHGAERVILQCGMRQPEAVALYTKLGYQEIAPYEPYASDMPNSLFFGISLGE